MRVRAWVGILIGGITDVATSMLIYFILAIIVAVQLDPTGQPADVRGAAVVSAMNTSQSVTVASWILSYIATLLGGYVAARIAREQEVRVGALSSWTCLALGALVMASASSVMPRWQLALIVGSTPFIAGLGGYLRLRQRRSAGEDGTPPASVAASGAQ
ncbi:MAG: hypothetical protein H7Z43_05270 [Clostridia bacterium]|nr:hypothetical protein [Deltaproteobacteria bacterium]